MLCYGNTRDLQLVMVSMVLDSSKWLMAQAQQKAPRDIARPVPGRVSMAGLTGLRAPGTLLILMAAWCSSAAPGVTQRLMSSWKLCLCDPLCHSESRSRKKALMRKFTVRSMVRFQEAP